MDAIQKVLAFLADNIFGQVPILIGLITLVGLLLQRKRIEDVVGGALRATIGVVILFIGIEVFTGGLTSFQAVLADAMGTTPPKADRTLTDFLSTHGGTIALVITVAFGLHVLLVRLFPAAHYLYLTGHLMFWVSAVTVAMLVTVAPGADQLTLVLCGAGFVAAYWTLQPLWMRPLMRGVIPQDTFGFAHTSSLTCVLAGVAARPLGSRERHDTEKLRLPRQLSFFKDVNVSTALVISVLMLIGVALADPALVAGQAAELDEKLSPWVWGLLVGLRFAGGIAILLFGVRMFLAEIVPAFKGISDKVIPGTRPALDAPTVFPSAPTAVMLGFVSATAVFLGCLGAFAAAGWFTLAPPMIMLFFVGGASAVFGNAVAGWRGALLGGVLTGLVLAIGQAVTWGALSGTAPELATLADPDWYAIVWLLQLVRPLVGGAAIWVVPGVALAATVGVLMLLGRRERRAAGRELSTA
ncbi:PTS system, ascorbate-specific IIC component [Amycolatopsis arida]|uniref:Ascorbate-specific PTS system EIIC component n=1 Tax=Amycolatopsis arida TaxID=587909 RepID=A0A1I5SDT7_9PSEU|nr:PTS ascorbate transporter subunit IIC [Amycolatopsis arida]TDX96508.1 PTS system ascorbate-specific IIC component [Amycolatopsis arida]SFP68895.1 PTS system, ascorbate-specific IIC component [Amycolatopsis arida]